MMVLITETILDHRCTKKGTYPNMEYEMNYRAAFTVVNWRAMCMISSHKHPATQLFYLHANIHSSRNQVITSSFAEQRCSYNPSAYQSHLGFPLQYTALLAFTKSCLFQWQLCYSWTLGCSLLTLFTLSYAHVCMLEVRQSKHLESSHHVYWPFREGWLS